MSGRKPISFLNSSERRSDALPTGFLQRLRQIKEVEDPAGILQGNFPLSD